MSQEKVDRYKKEKANRKQIMKREKRLLNLEKAGGCIFMCRNPFLGRIFCLQLYPKLRD